MIWLVLVMCAVLVVSWVIIYTLATRRIVQSTGQPTPEEARIETETKEQSRQIVDDGEKEKTEVLRADNAGLLARLRARVRTP